MNARRVAALALGLAFLASAPARADIGPKPRMYAPGMETRGELPGLEIEMTSEDVSVKLVGGPENRTEKLVVDASFHMTNLGEATEIEEGFPVGPIASNMTDFSIELDGKAVAFELVDIVTGKKFDPEKKQVRGGDSKEPDYWYVWKAPYKAKAPCVHKVKYTVGYFHYFYTMVDTGYVLHTGGRWKNAIGKGKVTFTVEGTLSLQNVYWVSPRKGLKREGDALVWTFENLKPNDDDDIAIHYDCETTWAQEVADARKSLAAHEYEDQYGPWLVQLLATAPIHAKRTEMTAAEHADYVKALTTVLARVHRGQDRWTVSGWKSEPEKLLGLLGNACDAVAIRPEDKPAREALADFVKVVERFEKGQLHSAEGPMKFRAWNQAEEQKRLDKNLAHARDLLGAK